MEALNEVAAGVLEDGELLRGPDAFGDNGQAQAVSQADDGGQQGGVVGLGAQLGNEVRADLDDIDGEAVEVGQRAEAGAEVVEGERTLWALSACGSARTERLAWMNTVYSQRKSTS